MNDSDARLETEEQRTRALDATLALVTRVGFQATTLASVAKESGLSESFILWHFRNKDGLFAEALEHSYRKRRAGSPSWSEAVLPEMRTLALRQNIEGASPPSKAGSEYRTFGLMLGLERRPVEPTARMRFIEFRRRTLDGISAWWERCLRIEEPASRSAAAELLANLTLSAVDGRFINSSGFEFDPQLTTDLIVAGLEGVALQLEAVPSAVAGPPEDAVRAVASLPQPQPSAHNQKSTRIQILRAAETVAANVGIDAASIARICKECGCSPTSVYWFFKDKNAIFEALIGFLYEDAHVTHPARSGGADNLWASNPVLEMTAHALWRYSGSANLMRISLMLFLHSEDTHAPIRDECLRVRGELRSEWAEGYVRAIPALAEAPASLINSVSMMYASLCDGLFVSQQIEGGDGSMNNYTWMLSEMMSAAIRSGLPLAAAEPGPKP